MSILTAYDKFIQLALKYGFSLFGLPKTGQTTVYQAGDDGTYQKGYPRKGVRFVDNGDGTITDKATGLMWVKQPENIGGVWVSEGEPVKVSWNDAIDNCNALSYAGFSDWRLPNVRELSSLLYYAKSAPLIDTTFFPNTKNAYYFTSTTYFASTTNAFQGSFLHGFFSILAKTSTAYVRPVRGGA